MAAPRLVFEEEDHGSCLRCGNSPPFGGPPGIATGISLPRGGFLCSLCIAELQRNPAARGERERQQAQLRARDARRRLLLDWIKELNHKMEEKLGDLLPGGRGSG